MQRIRLKSAAVMVSVLALAGAIVAGSAAGVRAQYADGYYYSSPNSYNVPHELQWHYDRNMDGV